MYKFSNSGYFGITHNGTMLNIHFQISNKNLMYAKNISDNNLF